MPPYEIKKCAVCETKENLGSHFQHYHITCSEHQQYGDVFLIELIRKRLGFIKQYSEKMTACYVCGCKLTETEIEGIRETDHTVLCEKHNEVRDWYQFHKEWFEFKITFPNADKNNKFDYKAFLDWMYEHKK